MKKLFIGLLVILCFSAFGLGIYLSGLSPQYDGSLALNGIAEETTIHFDSYGVPHIYAKNEEDAYFALGYVHAQERLFQMEMVRRVATGRLAEILGPEFIKTDLFFRTLGIREKANEFVEQELSGTPEQPFQKAALAYQQGVNTFVETGPTPLEFTIMGIPKSPFTPEDFYHLIGFMSVGFAEGFKTDPILTHIYQQFGPDYLAALALRSEKNTEIIPNFPADSLTAGISKGLAAIFNTLPVPLWHGSNGWVVGPEKSATGNVILTNDTHIQFSQPAVWYEAHLEYPGQSIYGHYAAGFPFAILGHNRNCGWGLTMLENDDVDFFIEEQHPDNPLKIKNGNDWEEMVVTHDSLLVKGEEPYFFEVKKNRHGPVINEVIENFPGQLDQPVSVWWGFTQTKSKLLESVYALGRAQNVYEIRHAVANIGAPGLNVMTGDAENNYAWFSVASLVKRPEHVNSKVFLNGDGSQDPVGFYDFTSNPHAINTPWHFVHTANNQPDSIEGVLYPGYYMPEDRALRIRTLLESKDKWTAADLRNMELDVTSAPTARIAQTIYEVCATLELNIWEQEMIEALKDWDGSQLKSMVQPSIYYTLLNNILFETMSDELGEERYYSIATLGIMKRSYLKLLHDPDNKWWDNIYTDKQESREDIFALALSNAYYQLAYDLGEEVDGWHWGRIHQLTHSHPLGTIDLFAPFFNVGPFEVDGGNAVINNMMFKMSSEATFPVTVGPAIRKVIDFGNVEETEGIIPTGQSGNVFSEHYNDQAEMFAQGKYRKLMMNKQEIESKAKGTLIIKPNE